MLIRYDGGGDNAGDNIVPLGKPPARVWISQGLPAGQPIRRGLDRLAANRSLAAAMGTAQIGEPPALVRRNQGLPRPACPKAD